MLSFAYCACDREWCSKFCWCWSSASVFWCHRIKRIPFGYCCCCYCCSYCPIELMWDDVNWLQLQRQQQREGCRSQNALLCDTARVAMCAATAALSHLREVVWMRRYEPPISLIIVHLDVISRPLTSTVDDDVNFTSSLLLSLPRHRFTPAECRSNRLFWKSTKTRQHKM